MKDLQNNYIRDLRGQRFGSLIVKEYDGLKYGGIKKRKTRAVWLTQCDCGNLKLMDNLQLRRITSNFCRCNSFRDLSGEKFGRLTAIKVARITKSYARYYLCKCECGVEKEILASHLKRGKIVSCGCFAIDQMCKRVGENHPSYRKDISIEDRVLMKNRWYNPEYCEWERNVFQRDDYTCQITGIRGGTLSAHHILNWWKYPDKRLDLSNGITLSKEIHFLFHKLYGNKHNNLEQLMEFKEKYKRGEI